MRSMLSRLTASTESHWSSLMRASVLSRVMPALWTTMSAVALGEHAGRAVGRDVELQRGPADAVGDLRQVLALGRDVDADHVRAVARQHLGDRRADAARRARDRRGLRPPAAGPSRPARGGRPRRPGSPARTRRPSGRTAGSAASTRDRRQPDDVHEVGGRAVADLLAERADEALERALRRRRRRSPTTIARPDGARSPHHRLEEVVARRAGRAPSRTLVASKISAEYGACAAQLGSPIRAITSRTEPPPPTSTGPSKQLGLRGAGRRAAEARAGGS